MNDIDLTSAVRVTAPDGSTVDLLGAVDGAGTAVFELSPGAVARAVRHPRVEEVWFVLSGEGRLWRRCPQEAEATVADLLPGRSLVLARGTTFQFRCDSSEPLRVLGTTSPVWEGSHDAEPADGPWEPTV